MPDTAGGDWKIVAMRGLESLRYGALQRQFVRSMPPCFGSESLYVFSHILEGCWSGTLTEPAGR